ncbi:hypothetical protein NE236_04205 [Actinoallomurus purpureus]|uniref:hypothetical protein n=1 Tax=Actinoallomurus purpureus TaxID=478114 RepID=UPI00209336F0|nr:hypothetical protein [Actinoallomurus purpureus]MCO6004174.1 hypothetical protein [Actinoallomurus purpureus]
MMQAIHKHYTRELYKQFHYFATWMPHLVLALGDVGVLREHRFDRMTSLAELGVDFTTLDRGGRAEYSYSSTGKVDISLDGEMSVPLLPGGEPPLMLTVTFSGAHATYFRAAQCRSEAISDLPSLEKALIGLRQAGAWRLEYVVVTELVRTGPAVILVADQAGARANLRVTAESLPVPAPVGGAAALNGSVTSGLAASVIAAEGDVTPLFRVAKLRRTLGGRPRINVRRPRGASSAPREVWDFAAVSWEEFAEGSEDP